MNPLRIAKQLNDNLDSVKDSLKAADKKKKGSLTETQMQEVLRKFGVRVTDLEKFKDGSSGEVDYIRFLKFYL